MRISTNILIATPFLAPQMAAIAQTPQQRQVATAQRFADDLVHGVMPKKITAKVFWDKQWTCEISISAELALSATGDDPERDCVQALLQVQRMGLI